MDQSIPLAAPLIAENQNEQRQNKLWDNENRKVMDMIKRQNAQDSLVIITRMKEMADCMRNVETLINDLIKSQQDNFNQLFANQKSQQDNFNQFTTKITEISERQHNDHVTLSTALISMQMETKRFMMFTSMMFIIIALVLGYFLRN
ncbi:unnamed protein product [Oppiella nova]|uniref:Uncharacterized protein n=1 Tax=Oppiella nova TaxID=334625 RepID=A0A7R9L9H2_9ACAR|nr:unnamed protein product [Oppiella nova]CAG2160831.1 unnamed protein product [Oppiella nova]